MSTPYEITVQQWAKQHRVSTWLARRALEMKVQVGHATKRLQHNPSPTKRESTRGLKFYVYVVTK